MFTISNVLFSQFYINDTLYISKGSLVAIKESDITNNGVSNFNSGTIHLNGTSAQVIQGSQPIKVDTFGLENSAGVSLQNQLTVNTLFNFVLGKLTTNVSNTNYFVEFLSNSVYAGYGSSSYIDGIVKKTGNQSFTFPLGNASFYAPMSITAPISVTDQFTAYYRNGYPPYNILSKAITLNNVSKTEYWILDRTNGSSNVKVTLSWAGRSGGVGSLSDLRVAHWNGSQWTDEGNSATTGTTASGTVTSNLVSSFSPFTISSVSALNPLPVELAQFNVSTNQDKKEINLTWVTASEKNTSHFEIERSENNKNWNLIGKVNAAGNSVSNIDYSLLDQYPNTGINYYRLKTVDLDSKYSYSAVKYGTISNSKNESISIYPNPIIDDVPVVIKSSSTEFYTVFITDVLGNRISPVYCFSNFTESVPMKDYSSGIYFLNYSKNGLTQVFKIIKK